MDLTHLWGGAVTSTRKNALDDAVINSSKQPYPGHPRLYGNNIELSQHVRAFEELDPTCSMGGTVTGVGTVKQMQGQWDLNTKGGIRCLPTTPNRAVPTSLSNHPDAKAYMDGTITTNTSGTQVKLLRALFLIRSLLYCHERNPVNGSACQFSAAQTQELITKFIAAEMTRLRNAPRVGMPPMWADEIGTYPAGYEFNAHWHKAYKDFFDLGAEPAFKFWTLFQDIFWDHPSLSQTDRTYIEQELEYEIDSFLMSAKKGHWNLINGNNWTPVLNNAALHWAILYYYEKPAKAQQVLKDVLKYNWEHRRYYLSDGGYIEGPSYLAASYGPMKNMQRLLMSSFGQILHSFNWFAAAQASPQWIIDNVSPDGRLVDFGDAWDNRGLSSFASLELMLHREILGLSPLGSQSPDACLSLLYFTNSYHDHGFYDPWTVEPAMARDWLSITRSCTAAQQTTSAFVFPKYGQGNLRQYHPGATAAGESATDIAPYLGQANQTFLTVNTVPNATPHREMDFGAVIWAAYGNRLIYDFGYGLINRNYFDYDLFVRVGGNYVSQIDHIIGASMIIIPSAFEELEHSGWLRKLYKAEADGSTGTIEKKTINGISVIRADGTPVYSGSSPALHARPAMSGPLEYFYRWLVPIENGNFLIIDAFKAKPGKESKIQEFWLTKDDLKTGCNSNLGLSSDDVRLTQDDSNSILLEPVCSMVPPGVASGTQGRIRAAGLAPGAFETSVPDFLPDDADFRADAITTRDGIAVLKILNNSRVWERRKLFRWVPDEPVGEDVRVFLLQASTQYLGGLPTASVSQISTGCGALQACFNVVVNNQARRITLTRDDKNHYQLSGLQ